MESIIKSICCVHVKQDEEQDTNTEYNSKVSQITSEANKVESTRGKVPSNIHIHRNQEMTTNTIENLPRLPIPSLPETIARFIEIVTPLLSPSQLNETKSILENFQKSDGNGPKLQSLLKAYDEEIKKSGTFGSYIEEFWNDAYLVPDDPLVLNVNPYFLLEEDADAKIAKDQILRASALTFNSLKFCASLKNGTMTPDLVKGKHLCMEQFKSLFGSCRIPKEGEGDKDVVDEDSSHVVVMFRNQIYHFQALSSKKSEDDEVTVAVDEADIAHILHSIVSDGKKISKATSIKKAIGVLTTLPRSSWARARNRLTKLSQGNMKKFQIIDSALFVLALDEFEPANVHEAAANMLHGTHTMVSCDESDDENEISESSMRFLPSLAYQGGTCCNRFYDKLQLIVCEDGSAGINFEHSAVDGHTVLRFVSDVFAQTVVAFAKSVTKSIYRGDCPIPNIVNAKVERASDTNGGKKLSDKTYFKTSPDKLTFDIDEDIHDQILFAESKLGDALKGDDTYILEFKGFGKNLIIHNSISPDSFVQMTILVSYYRLYGEVVNIYESVLTKHFHHGRTEAMRGTTTAAEKLMKCWTRRSATSKEKLDALRDAAKTHSKYVRQASEGKGVDRHLYALKCIAEKNNIECPLFSSDAWKALNHTVISTSNCGNPSLRLFGFGPVVPDGFGVGYIIKDNGLQYSISSKHRQTKRYALSLKETLLEMEDLLEPINTDPMGLHSSNSKNKFLRRSKVFGM